MFLTDTFNRYVHAHEYIYIYYIHLLYDHTLSCMIPCDLYCCILAYGILCHPTYIIWLHKEAPKFKRESIRIPQGLQMDSIGIA